MNGRTYILELLSTFVDNDHGSYFSETLVGLVKTLLKIKKGKAVVLEVD